DPAEPLQIAGAVDEAVAENAEPHRHHLPDSTCRGEVRASRRRLRRLLSMRTSFICNTRPHPEELAKRASRRMKELALRRALCASLRINASVSKDRPRVSGPDSGQATKRLV